MNASNALPEMENTPIENALKDWRRLNSDLMTANDSVKQLTDINSKLLAENELLKQTLDQTRRQKDYLQGYATTLSTRLKVVTEVIAEATSEAAKFSVPSAQPKENGVLLDRASEEGLAAMQLATQPPANEL